MGRYGVKSIDLSVQGDGYHVGTKTAFVRFTGCNLWDGHPLHRDQGAAPCAKWCDADFYEGSVMSTDDIIAKLGTLCPYPFGRVCMLTGGEPALQVDADLLLALQDHGWGVQVETNGTVENERLAHHADWTVLSPKRGTEWKRFGDADELRVVLPGGWKDTELEELFVWGKKQRVPHFYVQPQDPLIDPSLVAATFLVPGGHEVEDDRAEELQTQWQRHLNRCVQWVMAHPEWQLSFSAHKAWGLR